MRIRQPWFAPLRPPGRPVRTPLRARRIMLAGVLAGMTVFGAAAPASAADPGEKFGEHLLHCTEEAIDLATPKDQYLAFRNALEDCQKSPSIISPATPELLWGGIAFLIVAVALMKFAFPGLKKALAAREEKIRGDLEGAERARREAEEEKARYEAQLGDARVEANRIVEEAREAAEQVRRDLVARAESDAADIRARAQEDARLAADRAMSDLQQRVGEMSIELAERIVERNLDRDTQMALVDSYIASVGDSK
ncbi:MAG: F0F1 ATP synthase subunit B [Acidimicrobiia bacterium]